MASSPKKARLSVPTMSIGTHDGTFHADEALACYMLQLLPQYKNCSKIVRSRKPEVLDACDIVVDVGSVYDHSKLRYDHHQRGFEQTLSNDHTTKLSASGLVYKHYGHQIIKIVLETNDTDTETIFQKMYTEFMEAIDGIDNGIKQFDSDAEPNYRINTDLSARVGKLNPRWNATETDTSVIFPQAMALMGSEFMQALDYYGKSWLPARQFVVDSISKRFEADPTGEIMVLHTFVPWKDHLYTVEEDLKLEKTIKYVLYADYSGKWRAQCVPVHTGSFQSRKPLPEPWRARRDQDLSKESGIDGCVFVHASGFIGGNATYEGVLEMARKSLTM